MAHATPRGDLFEYLAADRWGEQVVATTIDELRASPLEKHVISGLEAVLRPRRCDESGSLRDVQLR